MMMCRRLFLSLVLGIGLLTGVSRAVPIEVENFSFELPNAGKQTGFMNVPGWSTDGAVSDSGVETGYTPTDGDWSAFLMSGDPSVWQLTDHTIVPGDVFELKVDARITWNATNMQLILYYDDNGTRVPAASIDVTLTSAMAEYTLTFSSNDVPESAGHQIGIEIVNSSPGQTWMGFDNVRLELIAEGMPVLASGPDPAHEQIEVPINAILSWTAGEFADKHDIYLGVDFNDVNEATPTNDPAGVYLGRFDSSELDTENLHLDFRQRYYWRVDEVNAPPDNTVIKGNIWSFTTESFAYPIPSGNITATASSSVAGQGPEKTIDGSGLDVNDLHSKNISDAWISAAGQTGPAWIQYEFDKAYKLNEMLVWNYNGDLILTLFGLKEVTIEYSTDGVNWTQLDGVTEFAQASGLAGYASNTTVEFGDVAAKDVRITAVSNFGSGSFFGQYGLSEVRFMYIPVSAREPSPADQATDVAVDTILGWRTGREAAEHNVYISTDEQAVIDGTAPAVTVSQVGYGPLTLDMGSEYFWRIDEVNNAETPAAWQGDIWGFATQDDLVVDDFESYNDIEEGQEGSSLVYLTWIDGYNTPSTNGSTIGFVTGASMETNIVHGGNQSVPVIFNNTAASFSEITAGTDNLDIGRDWTKGGAETMVLWFYGNRDNSVNEQMYVKINNAKVVYDGDVRNLTRERWTQWNIDLASLGINLSNVATLTIGFERTGATGGSGTVFIDDIRLYRSAPLVPVSVDPGTDALVAYYTLDNNVQDSSGNNLNGTIAGNPTYVTGVAGMALSLDGVDDYVNCGNDARFDITEQITLAAWVNTADAGNGENNPFVGKGDHTYAIKHSANDELQFFIYDGAWFTANVNVDSSFDGDWQFVAGTYDGSELKLYINGGVGAVRAHVGTIETRTHNLTIGTNSEATGRFYNGAIDDVRIYNRALSEGEILYLADLYTQ
jgi:hypothetical protein